MEQMNSIWLEEEHHNKLHSRDPNARLINSDKPVLGSRNTIELPPLPPTSYFQHTLEYQQQQHNQYNNNNNNQTTKSANKLLNAFKKLTVGHQQPTEPKLRKKISTPFGFSHISHIDKSSTITNRSFEIPRSNSVDVNTKPTPTVSRSSSRTTGIAFNRTSPQMGRTASNATSTFTTTRASVSTQSTSYSTHRKHSSTHHAHTTSSSSIEQLAKLEKTQISKQCQSNYSSSAFKFPSSTGTNTSAGFNSWDTPSPQNAVRQSWIYEEEPTSSSSPHSSSSRHSSPRKRIHSSSASSSYSPMKNVQTPIFTNYHTFTSPSNNLYHSLYQTNDNNNNHMMMINTPSPMKRDLNEFGSEVTDCFNTTDDEFHKLMRESMEDFQKLFKLNDMDETMVAINAAKFSRMSRLDSTCYNQDKFMEFRKDLTELVQKEQNDDLDDDDDKQILDDDVDELALLTTTTA